MMTNPFAYYDDEPLPENYRPLSVSSDGEEESDMEPRGPLELKGHFITAFLPAVRTYQINVVRGTLECRLPNGEYLQLSREEARRQVSIHGSEIDIVIPDSRSYCFRCSRSSYDPSYDLTLARLNVWLQPPQNDPVKARHAVAEQLKKMLLGTGFIWLCLLYLVWLVLMVVGDCFAFVNIPVFSVAFLFCCGINTMRIVCATLFFAFLIRWSFGQIHVRLLNAGALLSLIFPVVFFARLFLPEIQGTAPGFSFVIFFEIWFPFFIFGTCNRYFRSFDQLQRENGLV